MSRWTMGPEAPTCFDAVVIIPGIMGSELREIATDEVVWGLHPRVLTQARLAASLPRLTVTDEELAGRPRLRAHALLRVPGYLPMFRGVEPYSELVRRVRAVAADPRAVLEFPYDWRLSIEVNARQLVTTAGRHLDSWADVVRGSGFGSGDVRLVLVAHSMGGLVSRYACVELELGARVRRVITLGTPYYGSVKAIGLLATGEGAPVPASAAGDLARTCPGVYDLLPRYRCVEEQPHAGVVDGEPVHLLTSRTLTPADVNDLRGDRRLALEAAHRWERLALRDPSAAGGTELPALTAVAGAFQPTAQAIRLRDGRCVMLHDLDGVDHQGDSTVYRGAAAPVGVEAMPLPQKHGALAMTPEAITVVVDKLIGADAGPPLGTRPVGIDVADLVPAGTPVEVTVTGLGDSAAGVTVRSIELATGRPTTWPTPARVVRDDDGQLRALYSRPLTPGLHHVTVKAGGFSPVMETVLVSAEGS